jgi:hypothetical protein
MWVTYLFKKLPTDAGELEKLATSLGVSLFGAGMDTNEMQRRIIDHIRFRKDNALWLIVLLAGLSSLASAIAAWLAVLHK